MEWKDLGAKIAKAAPILGGILGGPVGGAAGTAISLIASIFGLSAEEATPEKINRIIESDPAALVKLRELEMANQLELSKVALEQARLEIQDRANARQREVETTRATGTRDINLYILAYVYVAGFFGSTGLMIWLILANQFPAQVPEYVIFLLGNLFGALTAGVTAVVQYFFGSSKGSSEKTRLLVHPEPTGGKP